MELYGAVTDLLPLENPSLTGQFPQAPWLDLWLVDTAFASEIHKNLICIL